MAKLVSFVGVALLVFQATTAAAQQQRPHQGRDAQRSQQMRPTAPAQRDPRPADYRQPETPRPGGGGMSSEERRQLRRDISDHGRDVYRDRR